MNRCSHPEHPHCTVWVMPGESACAHGHVQAGSPAPAPSIDLPAGPILPGAPVLPAPTRPRPHLRVSGFDPRAAGGRQVLKLELRGMPADCAPGFSLVAASRLRLDGGERHRFTRTGRGEWLPVFLEFSSRGLEHGQYRIALELHGLPDHAGPARTWVATLLILAPRRDASLRDIHQTFLATHKNVRVSATDASIARVKAGIGGGSVDIDVEASNAGIAHLDLDAASGKIDLGFSNIAWDEDLLEIDQPVQQPLQQGVIAPAPAPRHPCPASAACLGNAQGPVHRLRLFALDEWVLGRCDPGALAADLLLAHHGQHGPVLDGLTRRISARHAVIRRGRDGFEIEDVSRYGLLLDGAWPGKHTPVLLRTGMRIELTASIPGVAVLEVGAILPNGVLLRRADGGKACEAFYLLEPEREPAKQDGEAHANAHGLPVLFHLHGGFWQHDPAGGAPRPLTPEGSQRFAARPYPDLDDVGNTGAREEPGRILARHA